LEGRRIGTIALVGLAALAGCGGGERQDANEPEGDFPVELVDATFPAKQQLAQKSDLVITVRNPGKKTIPNIAVTVDGFDFRKDEPDLADPERPQFIINGVPREIGGFPESQEAAPGGCTTAYVNTWACGPLKAGKQRSFRWNVTAVVAGPYKVDYRVAAGLTGKASATGPDGGPAPRGTFRGTVSNTVPKARVADDGKTVVTETP
jgi:hypothetical protein